MKIRQDFVSNSSSSSYVVTGMNSLDELKTAICDALSDDRDKEYVDAYDRDWFKDLKKENLEKLNLYLPDTTAVFYYEGITNPIGIETSIVNRFVKNGIIIDEEKLEKFINYISKRYNDYMEGDENEYEFERELKESVSFRFIGTVTKDSIAILKWLKDHDKLFSKQRYIDNCKQALDNGAEAVIIENTEITSQEIQLYSNKTIIKVENTLEALYEIASSQPRKVLFFTGRKFF